MNEEELRAKVVELQESLDKLNEDLATKSALITSQENEIKILKDYNQKFFEKIPRVQVEEKENDKDQEPQYSLDNLIKEYKKK